MKTGRNRDRILESAINLFNHRGVSAVSTNHICEDLTISPGNLYFYFRNKEGIVRELFQRMTDETYSLWKSQLEKGGEPLPFLEESLELFWKYRFFHREMYQLRRQDPVLNKTWHTHLERTRKFMRASYTSWAKKGMLSRPNDSHSVEILRDLVLLTASSFFQFYESSDKPASKKSLKLAKEYIATFLMPYFTPKYREDVRRDLQMSARPTAQVF